MPRQLPDLLRPLEVAEVRAVTLPKLYALARWFGPDVAFRVNEYGRLPGLRLLAPYQIVVARKRDCSTGNGACSVQR